jgi:hypothetical protein
MQRTSVIALLSREGALYRCCKHLPLKWQRMLAILQSLVPLVLCRTCWISAVSQVVILSSIFVVAVVFTIISSIAVITVFYNCNIFIIIIITIIVITILVFHQSSPIQSFKTTFLQYWRIESDKDAWYW